MKKEPESRRLPRQDRSRQRLERILDAASVVFAESGYESATTEAIAERAGTSIGSLYQFFPNKLALFNAIAARYLERSAAIFDGLLTNDAPKASWEDLLDRSIDAFAASNREPGFRAVWTNWQVSPGIFTAGDALNREFASRTEAILATHAKRLPRQKRALVATIVVEVMSAMLLLAARRDEKNSAAIAAETKKLLRLYLGPYTGKG